MKTTEEFISDLAKIHFIETFPGNMESCILKEDLPEIMKAYTREAIKADRENVAKRGKVKLEVWTGGYSDEEHEIYDRDGDKHTYTIDKDSIINAPQIELK